MSRPICVEATAQVEQHLVRVAGADLARVVEPTAVMVVVADQQRPEPDSRPLGIGPSADGEFLAADALDLHPRVGPTRQVTAIQPLADDPLLARLARAIEPLDAAAALELGPADAIAPRHGPIQPVLARLKRQPGQVVAVEVEDVEEVDERRMPLHPAADLVRIIQVEPLLELAEAGTPLRVEAHDLAVHDRGPVEARPDRLGDLREPQLLRLVVPAQQRDLTAIEPGEDAEPVELGLEDPVGAVERAVDQGAQHRRRGRRHRCLGETVEGAIARVTRAGGHGVSS